LAGAAVQAGACWCLTSLAILLKIQRYSAEERNSTVEDNSQIRFVLRFISGRYQGAEFPLAEGRQLVIGRDKKASLRLADELVSREHAQMLPAGDYVILQDLHSTNGTFVNGERISKSLLKPVDQILIGTSIMKLLKADEASPATVRMSSVEALARLETTASRQTRLSTSRNLMSGSLDEVQLPDLLQFLYQSRKSGVLAVQTEKATGQVYLRNGQIYYAAIAGEQLANPQQALYRMAAWGTGNFELGPPDGRHFDGEMNVPMEALLLEMAGTVPQHGLAQNGAAEVGQGNKTTSMQRVQFSADEEGLWGSLQKIPLTDLLLLLSSARKSGVLSIRSSQRSGKIYLRDGCIYYATIEDRFAGRPRKALYRMLNWTSGMFEFNPPDYRQFADELTGTSEALLMEGVRQMDELRQIESELQAVSGRLAVMLPLHGQLRDLSPEELQVFQLVLNYGALETVLDNWPGTDLEACRHILSLLRHEFVDKV
jgi:pSer/pThr/pTyr-binding forkhead associated (FHA) protein